MTQQKKPRGLAAVSPERRKEIAALGGKATQAKGTGHHFDAESGKKAVAKRWANHKGKSESQKKSLAESDKAVARARAVPQNIFSALGITSKENNHVGAGTEGAKG